MKKLIFSLLYLFSSCLSADDAFSSAFTKGSVSGNLTLFAYNIDKKNQENSYANAFGGFLKYTTDSKQNLYGSVRFHQSSPVGSGKNRENTQLFLDDGSSLTALSEAFVAYKYKKRVFRAGNMMLQTPMMNDDTTRIVPWSYQGASLTSEKYRDLVIQLNYITQIRENTSDEYTKESASGEFDKGITMLGLSYQGVDELDLQAYYYHAPELYSTFIGEIDYKHLITDEYLLCLGAQYFKSGRGGEFNTREARNGGDDIDLVALKVGIDGPAYNVTLNYSQNFGLSGIVKGYGGLAKVFTTSMVANGRGNYKPETWMIKAHTDLEAIDLGATEFAIWLTNTRVKDSRGDDFNAFYSHLRHNFTHKASLYIRFEAIDYKNEHTDDVNYLRIIAAYNF